jgi:hypothetical protein
VPAGVEPIELELALGLHQIVCFDGRDRQGINALAKKPCRINPAESENSPIDRALFDRLVVDDRTALAK